MQKKPNCSKLNMGIFASCVECTQRAQYPFIKEQTLIQRMMPLK